MYVLFYAYLYEYVFFGGAVLMGGAPCLQIILCSNSCIIILREVNETVVCYILSYCLFYLHFVKNINQPI
jgi:hypothetical protein